MRLPVTHTHHQLHYTAQGGLWDRLSHTPITNFITQHRGVFGTACHTHPSPTSSHSKKGLWDCFSHTPITTFITGTGGVGDCLSHTPITNFITQHRGIFGTACHTHQSPTSSHSMGYGGGGGDWGGAGGLWDCLLHTPVTNFITGTEGLWDCLSYTPITNFITQHRGVFGTACHTHPSQTLSHSTGRFLGPPVTHTQATTFITGTGGKGGEVFRTACHTHPSSTSLHSTGSLWNCLSQTSITNCITYHTQHRGVFGTACHTHTRHHLRHKAQGVFGTACHTHPSPASSHITHSTEGSLGLPVTHNRHHLHHTAQRGLWDCLSHTNITSFITQHRGVFGTACHTQTSPTSSHSTEGSLGLPDTHICHQQHLGST